MSEEINKGITPAPQAVAEKPAAPASEAAPAASIADAPQPGPHVDMDIWGAKPKPAPEHLEHLATEVADADTSGKPVVTDDQHAPEWPPQRSAAGLPEGERAYGSTGQLFEAKSGRWERVQEQSPQGQPVVNRFDHLTQAEYLGEDKAETDAGGAAGGLPSPTPAHIGPQAPTAVLQHAAPESEEQWRTRSIALVAMYEHGMASNSPRTLAELREIKALLDIE